ncbi:MAG TPA: DUF1588 domain-containing protein, partial [Polyangia bacterium]
NSGNPGSQPGAGGSNTTGTGGVGNDGSWFAAMKATDCSKAPTPPPSRVYRLNATQWKNTVEQVLSVTGIDVSRFAKDEVDPHTGFNNDAAKSRVTLPLANLYFELGEEVATKATAGALQAHACLSAATLDSACAQKFVADYGQRLFRRPLTSDEQTTYVTFLSNEAKLDKPSVAATSLLRALLMSPGFLYRTELGASKAGQVELTGHEIASLLSYTIGDVPPDAALLQAAAAGKLSNAAERESHARRLAGLPGARAKLADFWRQYLGRSEIPAGDGIDTATAAAMIKETDNLFDRVVWEKSGGFSELLTASYTYADPKVATLYGAPAAGADGRITLDPKQRAGFLTHASFLVGTATPSQTSTVIHRGLLVRERLLCLQTPALPPDVVPNPALAEMAGPNATARENYELFARQNPGCNACHSAFQPLGLAFENYDKLGRYRSKYDSGKPIVSNGELVGAGDASGDYADVPSLAAKIGASQISQYCFSKQFAQYALGRALDAQIDACTIKSVGDHLIAKGGSIRELFAALAHTPAVYRRIHE